MSKAKDATLTTGVVESISSKQVIVKHGDDQLATLKGEAVEKIAGDLKLGAMVEFDHHETPTLFALAKGAKAKATAARTNTRTPSHGEEKMGRTY